MENSTAQQILIAQFYNLSAVSLYFPFTKKILKNIIEKRYYRWKNPKR